MIFRFFRQDVGIIKGYQDDLISWSLSCPSAVSDWINFPKMCLRELQNSQQGEQWARIQLHFGGFQSCTVQPCDFKSCTVAKFLNFQSPPAVRFNPRCNLLARRISQMLIAAEFWHFSAFNRWLGPMMCMWAETLNMIRIATKVRFCGAFCTGSHNMWDVDCKIDDKISVALQTWNNVGFYVFCATWTQSMQWSSQYMTFRL